MKLHVLSLPHAETTSAFSTCAYTQRTADFASMMTDKGYHVCLYAGENNEARVTEHIALTNPAEQRKWFPKLTKDTVFTDFDAKSLPWRRFNARAVNEIKARSSKGDILCITMGVSHRPVAKELPDLRHVETGIGYMGVWAPHRVFESIAWRHFMASREKADDLRWFDEVIPRGYFVDQFPEGSGGNDYLFLGRLTGRKGPKVAADLCQAIGARLLIAGQGMRSYEPGKILVTNEGVKLEGNVHYLGLLNPVERAVALGSVRAVIMPTIYLEPGGGVAIEAQLCGTPVLATPWGAMTETVLAGKTGYHCSTLKEFVEASRKVGMLDRKKIRASAQARFCSTVIASRYDAYFKKLQTLSGKGWYQL